MLKKIVLVIVTLIFLSVNSHSKEIYQLNLPDKIKIKLSTKNYNRYIKLAMRAYVDGSSQKLSNIKREYKKWINADLLPSSKKGKTLKAEIKILGEMKDHIRLPVTSLKVKILDDDFHGLRRFNLFLPHTRNGNNEIFWTLLLRYTGFPTFYTKKVEVNLNGKVYDAILQEDASKEFLERNFFRETVILKNNDFRFSLNEDSSYLYKTFFSSSMIADNRNFIDHEVAVNIVSEAIALYSKEDFDDHVINFDLFKKINEKYSWHSLLWWNIKYIYIPHQKKFIPLYYDGIPDFSFKTSNCVINERDRDLKRFNLDYRKLSNSDLTYLQKCVFHEIFDIFTNFNSAKVSNKTTYDKCWDTENCWIKYNEIKDKILNFLQHNNLVKEIKSKGMIYTFLKDDKYFSCVLDIKTELIKQCKNLSYDEYKLALSTYVNYDELENLRFFPINLGSFDKIDQPVELFDVSNSVDQTIKLDMPNLYILNLKNKNIKNYEIFFENYYARLIITGDISEDDRFSFFGNVNSTSDVNTKKDILENEVIRFDKNLLTGCVTFLNSDFNGGSIFSKNLKCEDSINIVNSKGKIDKIEILDSKYDGLDIDFSDILIKKMNINNSGNDCADFSFGNYKIFESTLSYCQDKGISFGERSIGLVKNSIISESTNGFIAKDNSFLELHDSRGDKILKYCLAAYNKKPEFEGAKIIKNNFKCVKQNIAEKIKEYTDSKSIIQ